MRYLEVLTREGARRIRLEGDCVSIGRLSYNDVVIAHAQVSREHAEIRLIQGAWWISDKGSTNGLRVNGERVQEHRLVAGDAIVLAPEVALRFVEDAAPAAIAAAPSLAAAAPPAWGAPSQPAPAAPTPRLDGQPARSPLAREPRAPFAPGAAPSLAGPAASPAPTLAPAPAWSAPPPARPSGGAAEARGDLDLPDPYRRSQPANEAYRATSAPAGTRLHVCQTCGQLTAPDAVYCQSCHHAIAYECPTCHLSLLPIQERCPRCQAPNPGSVRRAHRHAGL